MHAWMYVNKYIVLCLQYYAESHAVIYIVDSSDRDRIPDSKETFGKITYFRICLIINNVI